MMTTLQSITQGFAVEGYERLPLIEAQRRSSQQQSVAQALIDGPRKGVKGPYVPLLYSPELAERLGRVGEYLRFDACLPVHINEFVTLIVARHVSNQFEWSVHYPLAHAAGIKQDVLEMLAQGARPVRMSPEETVAYDFTTELLNRNGVCDMTYAAVCAQWGEQGVVELTSLVGYFVCVSWVMNVARTPAPASGSDSEGLSAFPL